MYKCNCNSFKKMQINFYSFYSTDFVAEIYLKLAPMSSSKTVIRAMMAKPVSIPRFWMKNFV